MEFVTQDDDLEDSGTDPGRVDGVASHSPARPGNNLGMPLLPAKNNKNTVVMQLHTSFMPLTTRIEENS